MCGRYTVSSAIELLRQHYQLDALELEDLGPRYNVAPTQVVPVVGVDPEGRRKLRGFRWGLIPRWSKDKKQAARMINARSETVFEKPSFRRAIRKRRVLVPCDGFYEWKRTGPKTKQPYFFAPTQWPLFTFAGIWEAWTSPEGEEVRSVAILTTLANDELAAIHHRQPVVLPPSSFERWLDPSLSDPDQLEDLFQPRPGTDFQFHPVDPRVGKVREDDPGLIEPWDLEL